MNERTFSILLIDDDTHTCNLFKLVMDFHQIALTVAENAEVGLEFLAHNQPDIIVIDIFLRQTDGYKVLKRIRDMGLAPDIPVVATTAYYADGTERALQDWGFHGFLPKPFETSQLVDYLMEIAGWTD